MKFKSLIGQVKEATYYPCLKIKNLWPHLVIIILVIANPLVTFRLIEYFSTRQNNKNIDRIADNYSKNISDRLLTHLDNSQEIKDIGYKDRKTRLYDRVLDKYLSKINISFLVQVTIINQDGLIVASNFKQPKTISALTNQDILTYLQQKLGTFFDLHQPRKLSFKIKQQYLLAQVNPWENQELGLNWLVVVTIPKSELLIDSAAKQNNLLSKYLAYLLPTILLGLLTYIWTIILVRKSSQSREKKLVLGQGISQETEREKKQTLPSKNQSDRAIKTIEETVNYEPYILLAAMSHELRSPLNAILGFAQIMEQELSTTQESQENIAIINRSGERLLSIINDVVDLAKIETNRLTLEHNNIDFYAWLDHIEQNFKFQAHHQGWEFSLIRQGNLPQYICIDERRLRQIIRNLVYYCLKSTQTADISLKVASCCSLEKTAGTNQQDSDKKLNLYFEVKNANFSVTPTELATLFDPMVRVRQEQKSVEGSSLNLPISRKLSQLMGGDITLGDNSISGLGIIFNLEIQTESIIAQKLQIKSNFKRIIGLESDQIEYRILIVDDSKTSRMIMSRLLEPVGFKVQEAVNGKEAIDIWLRWQPHMIWMDLKMPVMNGYEATERIKSYSQTSYTPIVALSASTLEEEKSLFKAAGCDDFVGKPYSENVIFDKIAQHLGIRYVYEPISPSTPSNFKSTADTLNIMSNQWLNQVEQAAIVLDRDLLTQLLQQIPLEHSDLKNALQKQINNFDFDTILTLARNSKSN